MHRACQTGLMFFGSSMLEYVALDLETTGFDPNVDSILEVGMVRFSQSGEIARYSTLVDPHRSVPYPVQRLTGITSDELEGAPSFEEIAEDIAAFVENSPVIGHSVSFDLNFLAKQGVAFFAPHYDTMDLSKILITRARSRGLGALADQLGIPFLSRHRALPDAAASMELFLSLIKLAERLDPFLVALLASLDSRSAWQAGGFFRDVAQRLGIIPDTADLSKGAWPSFVSMLEQAPSLEPLAARSSAQPIDLGAIRNLLSPGGALSCTLPSFEHREEQVTMALETARSLNQGRNLIVEAGTGTGKSFAYLLPAAITALQTNSTVVISTNTINLQEQLINKDIPDLASALSALEDIVTASVTNAGANKSREEIETSSIAEANSSSTGRTVLQSSQLKGKGNYLCLRRLGAYLNYQKSPEESSFLARVLVWLTTTHTGDRGELSPNTREAPFWEQVSARESDCTGNNCAFYRSRQCFLLKARQRAEAAHLLVVNHALLLSDLLHERHIIPEYDYLIIDEAHHLEEVATAQLGVTIRNRDVADYLDSLYQKKDGRTSGLLAYTEGFIARAASFPAAQTALVQRVRESAILADSLKQKNENLFYLARDFLSKYSSDKSMYGHRLRVSGAMKRYNEWGNIERAWEGLNRGLEQSNEAIGKLAVALQDMEIGDGERIEDLISDMQGYVAQCERLQEKLAAFISSDEKQVSWLEVQAQGNNISLNSAPLDVASELDNLLFSKKSSVVLTSATLQVAGSFGYIKERLGAAGATELSLESPFNYEKSTLLYIAGDIPEPEKREHSVAMQKAIVDACTATSGRALVLFTSYSALQAALSNISAPLEREGIRVLAQGTDGNADQVLSAFKQGPKCVLLGTSSLWEGIDVVGDALSLLIITRLPFPVPTDPVFAARGELYQDPFNQYSVPQAILRFRQGFGRLIRSNNDRGAILVLDPRIITKRYGAQFLKSLPQCTTIEGPLRDAPQQISSWLKAEIG
ncbi:MAG: DEAD/DEAH box helicase [Dehalococcoidia bacterium]|nr:DEAD/DEAH box helicase [Dehalococcoidia bacterium]